MSSSAEEAYKELKKIFEQDHSTNDNDPKIWLKLVRDKLYSMLRAPMKEDYHNEAFKWIANLSMSIGDFSWLIHNDDWTKDDAKVFGCIANLSMNEIHILLPLIQRHLSSGDSVEEEKGKILVRSASVDEYERFGDHLVILESTVKSLVANQDDQSEDCSNALTTCISSQELQDLLKRLRETILSISDYLEIVHRYWFKLVEQIKTDKFTAAEGALRMTSVWLSEDPTSLEAQCKRFLIDLLIKNLLLVDRPMHKDLMILAIHSACTQSDEVMASLRGIPNYKEALQNYLDHVQNDSQSHQGPRKRDKKILKLRCGLVKDLLSI